MMVSESFSIASPLVTAGDGQTVLDHNRKYRIGIVASGSRGDIQPYIALGLHLRSRGHYVTIATEKRMKSLVDEFELKYECIEGDPCGVLFQPEAQAPLKSGSLFALMKLTSEWDKKWNKLDIYNSYLSALKDCDVIISAALTLTPSYCVAEYYKAVWIPMILGPTMPTSEFPVWPLESMIFCRCLNRWSYNFLMSQLWSAEKALINKWRKESLGLPEIQTPRGMSDIIDNQRMPVIVAYSQFLCPNQRIPGDYGSNIHLNGFIFVPSTTEKDVDPKIVQFINKRSSDPRPILYLGFGSMPAPDVNELIHMSIDICKQSNSRGLLVGGWSSDDLVDSSTGELKNLSLRAAVSDGSMLVVKAVPHDWVFPRVNCIIHHGGIGTTAAALRSGVPQVICAVMLDQPHNAKSVVNLGCSPGFVKYNTSITAAKVSNLVKQVLPSSSSSGSSNKFIQAAKDTGELVRKESLFALDTYSDVIESHILLKRSTL